MKITKAVTGGGKTLHTQRNKDKHDQPTSCQKSESWKVIDQHLQSPEENTYGQPTSTYLVKIFFINENEILFQINKR